MASTTESNASETISPISLPRVSIKFCTQCKWMLRAAYFAQELLSTFSTSLGEVSLIPSTGGVFTVELVYALTPDAEGTTKNSTAELRTQTQTLWDRKTEGGFPETKELKKRVRDIIDPTRDLGHVDGKKKSVPSSTDEVVEAGQDEGKRGQEGPRGAEGEVEGEARGEVKGKGKGGEEWGEGKGEAKGEGKGAAKVEIKRNPDGSICEDCN